MTIDPSRTENGLHVGTAHSRQAVLLTLHGDLDHDSGEHLLAVADRALSEREGTATVLRLDCRELGAVDSMGLSALLHVHRRAAQDGLFLQLEGIPERLERLLRLTGTYEHFTGYATLGEEIAPEQ
ncbi:STAS domain-containing protein [Streptomyces sp. NPDC001941]|uniref:STAS domain-containing protein n=1 Tax=Streptomyces sp. NPDC001941 TaxID=3154659 RepID=UPI00331EB7BB